VKCGRIIRWEYKGKLDSIVSFSAVLQLTQHICWWELCLGLSEEVFPGSSGRRWGFLWTLLTVGYFSRALEAIWGVLKGFCGCCGAYHRGRAWHRRQTGGWDTAGNHTQWFDCSSVSTLSYPKESAPILFDTSHRNTAESRSHPARHISRQHISGSSHQIQYISLKMPLASVHWVAVMGSLVLFLKSTDHLLLTDIRIISLTKSRLEWTQTANILGPT
jgi:hypothetical protein